MLRTVKCDCCNTRIAVSNAIPQYDDTYLCPVCDEEVTEEAEKQWEAEEYVEIMRMEVSLRRCG